MGSSDVNIFLDYIYPILVSIPPSIISSIVFIILFYLRKKEDIKKEIRNLKDKISEAVFGNEKVILYRLAENIDALERNISRITKDEKYSNIPEVINYHLTIQSFEQYLLHKEEMQDINEKDIKVFKDKISKELLKLHEIAEK